MVRIGIVGIGFMGVTHFKAIDKVKEVPEGHGLECWRRMHVTWEPRTKGRFGGMLQRILTMLHIGIMVVAFTGRESVTRRRTSSLI